MFAVFSESQDIPVRKHHLDLKRRGERPGGHLQKPSNFLSTISSRPDVSSQWSPSKNVKGNPSEMHFSLIFWEAHSLQLLLHHQGNHSLSRFLLVLKIWAISQPTALFHGLQRALNLLLGSCLSREQGGFIIAGQDGFHSLLATVFPLTHHRSCYNASQNFARRILCSSNSTFILWLSSDPSMSAQQTRCLNCLSGHISLRKRFIFFSMSEKQWAIPRALLFSWSPEGITHAVLPLSPTVHCTLHTWQFLLLLSCLHLSC